MGAVRTLGYQFELQCGTWSVCKPHKNYICSKINAHTIFYVVRKLSTSARLCQDVRISIDPIQVLQLVLCGTRLHLLILNPGYDPKYSGLGMTKISVAGHVQFLKLRRCSRLDFVGAVQTLG